MPNNSRLQMKRALTIAEVDLGDEPLTVIATHLHHSVGEDHLRLSQAQALIGAWNGEKRTVILGDFNAEPDDATIGLLREAGLKDALLASQSYSGGVADGGGAGYTSPSDGPSRRLDYISISPDLEVSSFSLTGGLASDHLGVAATID